MIRPWIGGLLLALAACAPGSGDEAGSNRSDHQRIDPRQAPPPAK
ncbi:hypothetical protein VVT58_10030 [Sphingobium sp. SJ10-10]|nr:MULTISPECIES: hypothetical protein [Sphingomonadaceae]MEC6701657.1 hypothetical protein [Sphingobium sp. SJ10-10]